MGIYIVYNENNTIGIDLTALSISEWEMSNPSKTIIHAFTEKSDIISYRRDVENQLSTIVGMNACCLTSNDLTKTFTNSTGDLIKIIGYNNRNRKYKYIIENQSNNHRLKVTERYIRNLTEVTGNN